MALRIGRKNDRPACVLCVSRRKHGYRPVRTPCEGRHPLRGLPHAAIAQHINPLPRFGEHAHCAGKTAKRRQQA